MNDMRCPQCQKDNDRVLETRILANGAIIRRRRRCLPCDFRFTSYERLEEQYLIVIKKNNNKEPFDINKIESGIQNAVRKRPITFEKIKSMLDKIEEDVWLKAGSSREVTSAYLGELVIIHLQKIDTVAYLRFASVYRNFESIEQFIEEIKTLSKETAKDKNGRKVS